MRRVITVSLAFVLTLIMVVASQPARPFAAGEMTLARLASQDLSLDQAQAVVTAALAAAEEQGTKMNIAVVDAGGNLKAFSRMDGAWLESIDIVPPPRRAPPATSIYRARNWEHSRSRAARSTASRSPTAG